MHRLPAAGIRRDPSDSFRFHHVIPPFEKRGNCHTPQYQPSPQCCLRPAYVVITQRDEAAPPKQQLRLDPCPKMCNPNTDNQRSSPRLHCTVDVTVRPAPPAPPPPLPVTRGCQGGAITYTRDCARPPAPRPGDTLLLQFPSDDDREPLMSQGDQDTSKRLQEKHMYVIKREPVRDTYTVFPAGDNKPAVSDARRRNSAETKFWDLRAYDKHYPNLGFDCPMRPPVLQSRRKSAGSQ